MANWLFYSYMPPNGENLSQQIGLNLSAVFSTVTAAVEVPFRDYPQNRPD